MNRSISFLSFLLAGSCPVSLTCTDSSTEPDLNADTNLPITTNVPNSFTYALHARQYSESMSQTLNFTSDSPVLTLTAHACAGGLARFEVFDSLEALLHPVFRILSRADIRRRWGGVVESVSSSITFVGQTDGEGQDCSWGAR